MAAKKAHDQNNVTDSLGHEADTVLRGGTVLNVYSGELLEMDVAIKGERIWYVGFNSEMVGRDTLILDVANRVLVPGYIEPHCHPWNIYNPVSIGEEACRLGTTTLFCDNLFFYLFMGMNLFQGFMDSFSDMPIHYFWSCRVVPQTPMEMEDEIYSLDNLISLLKNPNVQSLGEITRWPELLKENPKIMRLIGSTRALKKRIDGHTAGAKYEKLNAISRAGVESCHESIKPEEVLDRLRLGIYVMLRESSLRRDLVDLLRAVIEHGLLTDRIMLTTDGSSPEFYQERGFTDNLIKIALGEGVDPISAYRMSTINPAVYFGLDHEIGGIAPGRSADILVLKDLFHPRPEVVISKGHIVSREGKLTGPFPQVDWERFLPQSSLTNRIWHAENSLFRIPSTEKMIEIPTIRLVNAVITRSERIEFETKNGFVDLNGRDGFCFSALVNRDGRWVTNGIIRGFGDAIEGLASSFNTALEILVIGRDPLAMSEAVNRVLEIKGGIVAIENGKPAYELPLSLGGMMSDAPMRELAEKERELKEFLSARGYPFHDPLYTLVFLPNDFLPDVRINYNGVFDIRRNKTLWPRRDLV